ncbi:MAG: hypothetical protein J0I93_02320 [Legionella sp.]|nr:hypothetical protein [Legionella sp.]
MNSQNKFSTLSLLYFVWQNKRVITLSTLFGLVVGYGYIHYSTPIYETSVVVTAATEGDIAPLNLGRSWARLSPLKPFTAKDVYLTFSTILLSDAAKEAFFKQFYLSHPLTKEEFNTPETIALYRQFLRNFMIVEGKKSFSDRFAKFTIALRGENPQELVTKLQNFLTVLNQQTFENLSEIINKQKAVLISTLEHQLTAEQATAQQKIRDQIQSLEHQLRDLQAYEDDPFTPQQDGPAWIEVKIDNLRAQLKHGANTPKIRELQGQVRYYQNLTIDAQKTIVFHIDGAIKTPVVPVLPQPRLTLMVGATSGFLLGILLILFQLAWRKERSLIKPLFEQPA